MQRTPAPKKGIHPGNEDYHRWDAVSFTRLKNFDLSPAHVQQYMIDPPEVGPAAELGTAVHHLILQPDTFEANFVRGAAGNLSRVGPKRENEAIKLDNPGKTVIRDADWPNLFGMRDALWRHPQARVLLENMAHAELPYVWEDPETGLRCKAKVDLLTKDANGYPCQVDLKSIRLATPRKIAMAIHDRGYHIQSKHYLTGLFEVAPADRRSLLLFVESAPPYCPRVVEIGLATLELGQRTLSRWLADYKRCLERKHWPGYAEGAIDIVDVPEWVFRDEERELDEMPGGDDG